MRFALAFLMAIALGLPASGQTTPKRRLFTAADYDTYFAAGDFRTQSPTYDSISIDRKRRENGKLMTYFVEVAPKWNRSSLYPFVKMKGVVDDIACKFDRKQKLCLLRVTDAHFELFGASEVWLSNDRLTAISPGDVRIGSIRGYYKTLSKADGWDPEEADEDYRATSIGTWTFRCEFVEATDYEVECAQQNIVTEEVIIRRYLKQAGLS